MRSPWFSTFALTLACGAACSASNAPHERNEAPAARHAASTIATVARAARTDAASGALHAMHAMRASARPITRDAEGRLVSVRTLAARLPVAASGALEVGASPSVRGALEVGASLGVRVTLEDAARSTAVLEEGAVVYPDAQPSVDRAFFASESALEEVLVLRDARAPSAFTWHVDVPPAFTVSRDDARANTLLVRDEHARGVMRIAPPYAIDAQGTRREAPLAWDDRTRSMHVTLDTRDLAYPIVLDPTYEAMVWTRTDFTPEFPLGALPMVYDEARAEIIAWDGSRSRMWRWTGSQWAIKPVSGPAPALTGSAMAYDATRQNTVLFGGATSGPASADTWLWNGSSWTKASPATSPSGRALSAMAFDRTRNEVVLYGGGSLPAYDETWTWNGATWTLRTPGTKPTSRNAHALVYDEARRRVVLFGGISAGAAVSETYLWDGTNWSKPSTPTGPEPHENDAMIYDPVRAEVLLFGVDRTSIQKLWRWNGSAWSAATTSGIVVRDGAFPVSRPIMAFDRARGVAVLRGADQAGRTYTWDGSAWAAITHRARPNNPRAHMAYDAARHETIYLQGSDTWRWNGSAWSLLSPSQSPSISVRDVALAYDAARAEIVRFGGYDAALQQKDATWIWNGTTWIERMPAVRPAARSTHALAYDAKRARVAMFGGTTTADTWLWDGASWTQAMPQAQPSARNAPMMVYDALRERVVLFGGVGVLAAAMTDTWTWDGAVWTEQQPPVTPSARSGAAMASTPRGDIFLVGGQAAMQAQSDAWRFDGTEWSAVLTSAPPTDPSSSAALVFEPERGSLRLFGVGDGDTAWELYYAGGACAKSADCPGAYCTDGVCCQVDRCGSCETCNGLTPGKCYPVLNREDPDSCPLEAGKACSALGDCKRANGAAATETSQCASGFVVDGVCCDSACNEPCQACARDVKESPERDGVCGNRAPALCACTSDAQCAPFHHCASGVCAVDRGAMCDSDRTLVLPSGEREDCGLYHCEASACLTRCSNRADCALEADCTREGTCVVYAAAPPEDGCAVSVTREGTSRGASAILFTMMASLALRRRSRDQNGARSRKRGLAFALVLTLVFALVLGTAACGLRGLDGARGSAEHHPLSAIANAARHDAPLRSLLAAKESAATMGAGLPAFSDEATLLRVARGERASIAFRLVGSSHASARVEDGSAVYRDVFPGVDRVFVADATRLEELLVLRDARAPTEAAWEVTLPSGVASVVEDRGGLAFRGQHARDVLRVAPPYVIDAKGARRDATLAWEESARTMRIAFDPAGLLYPIVLDPRFETVTWIRAPLPPVPATIGVMAYDVARAEVLLWEADASTMWRWNGTTWSSTQGVGPSFLQPMVYDRARQNTVMLTSDGSRGYTWVWNGTAWADVTPATAPPPRYSHAIAYDRLRSEVVVFGGQSTLGPRLNDTWVWNGVLWTRRTPAVSPSARADNSMAFDGARGVTVMFGQNEQPMNLRETWTWNGTTWSKLNPTTQPTAVFPGGMDFDEARGEVLLFGGMINTAAPLDELWRWNGTNWSLATTTPRPVPRTEASVAYDSARGMLVAHGSQRTNTDAAIGDTWGWNGSAWSRLWLRARPASNAGVAAYDAARSETILLGGTDRLVPPLTWRWNGSVWSRIVPAHTPGGAVGAASVYDARNGNIVFFGGSLDANAPSAETWTWDGTDWTQRTPTRAPSARRGHAMAYDAKRQRVVLFGGRTATTTLDDTWTWDGVTWTQESPAVRPSARGLAAMAYDAVTERVLLFGGLASGTTYNGPGLSDTWLWDGATWTELALTASPPGRGAHGLAASALRGELVLAGGITGSAPYRDTWRWNGASWQAFATRGAPPPVPEANVVHDDARDAFLLFGALTNPNIALNELNVLKHLGGGCASGAECPTGNCVDGVCCEVATCGTCETCAGLSPGKCTKIQSAEDADTCAVKDGKSCNEVGECRAANGASASDPAQCASGHVVDGVCCESACNGVCQACSVEAKDAHARGGVCGNRVPAMCACASDAECAQFHHCESGVCAADRKAYCESSAVLIAPGGDRIACGLYPCKEDKCGVSCASRADCAEGADCTLEGRCIAYVPVAASEEGGCSLTGATRGARGGSTRGSEVASAGAAGRASDARGAWVALVVGLAWVSARGRRRAQGQGNWREKR